MNTQQSEVLRVKHYFGGIMVSFSLFTNTPNHTLAVSGTVVLYKLLYSRIENSLK